ncbi:hypothetical protein OUZ56_014679 [Daphnia magna]|uniref:Uncharacterized protein n=1 Tax=Daphnia magna TaxID=35525 RepID=A0ABR0AKH7_9CRUS|nr:hypothetical protein OUZ56_014679 [Daphnia magna]
MWARHIKLLSSGRKPALSLRRQKNSPWIHGKANGDYKLSTDKSISLSPSSGTYINRSLTSSLRSIGFLPSAMHRIY